MKKKNTTVLKAPRGFRLLKAPYTVQEGDLVCSRMLPSEWYRASGLLGWSSRRLEAGSPWACARKIKKKKAPKLIAPPVPEKPVSSIPVPKGYILLTGQYTVEKGDLVRRDTAVGVWQPAECLIGMSGQSLKRTCDGCRWFACRPVCGTAHFTGFHCIRLLNHAGPCALVPHKHPVKETAPRTYGELLEELARITAELRRYK